MSIETGAPRLTASDVLPAAQKVATVNNFWANHKPPTVEEFGSQVGAVFSPLSKEPAVEWNSFSGPVRLDQFLDHVKSTGLENAFSSPLETVYKDVYLADKALRPDPATYLHGDFIAAHTEQFLPGAARVDVTKEFNKYNAEAIKMGLPFGRADAVFISPASLIDKLYATGNPAVMETTLGFPIGALAA